MHPVIQIIRITDKNFARDIPKIKMASNLRQPVIRLYIWKKNFGHVKNLIIGGIILNSSSHHCGGDSSGRGRNGPDPNP